MGHEEHKRLAPHVSVGFAVITISDSRTEESDESGRVAVKLLQQAGHEVVDRRIIRNDTAEVRNALRELLQRQDLRVILTSGGTGIGKRDLTVESVEPFLEKKIEGFGALFRSLSYEEIGPASMLSRAFGGIALGKLIFCLPGSKKALELGLTKLILPEIDHMIWELDRP